MSPIEKRHKKLIGFVLAEAEKQPVLVRVDLYRALAEVCGCAEQAETLRGLAKEFEEADSGCREFAFKLKAPSQPDL